MSKYIKPMTEREKKKYIKTLRTRSKQIEKEKRLTELLDELVHLVNKHGIKQVLITLKDICHIKATDSKRAGKNKRLAKWWEKIGNQIEEIKIKERRWKIYER